MRTPRAIVEALLEQSGRASPVSDPVDMAIKRMAADLRVRALETEECTLTQGGCFAVAAAIRRVFGGALWAVAVRENEGEDWGGLDWAVDHALVRIGDNFYDGSGRADTAAYLQSGTAKRPKKLMRKGAPGLWWPYESEMGIRETRIMANVLREYASGLVKESEDDFDLAAEIDSLPDARRVARWPFTLSELHNPEKCTENDVFMAMGWDRFGEGKLFHVRRNCSIIGSVREGDEVDFDSLATDPEQEYADEWRDVYVKDGRFAGFVQEGTE